MEEIGKWVGENIPSFAKGLHVLVVDHDKHSLHSLASMLEHYSFKVTTTQLAKAAMTKISECSFKLAMVDASIPDMNSSSSLSFLHSLLQKDIPTILMFSERDMNMASKEMAKLGCNFLEKPISMEDIELLWQHVYRKNRNPNPNPSTNKFSGKENRGENSNNGKKVADSGRDHQECGDLVEEEGMKEKDGSINGDHQNPSANFGVVTEKIIEEDEKMGISGSMKKRSRTVWNSKLHRKFTEALSKLGNKKSSPKIILKMMNEPSLTLRQVASHLQKYKSQVKHLNQKASMAAAASDPSNSLSRIHFQHFLRKQNTKHILGQSTYISELRELNGPELAFRDAVASDLRILNQKYSNSYAASKPNDLQPETYGGFAGTDCGEDRNGIFAANRNVYENSENFVQISQSDLQYFSADVDYSLPSAENQFPDAIQEMEFDQNLTGCLYPQIQNHHGMESGGRTEELLLVSGNISSCNSVDIENLIADAINENQKLTPMADSMNQTVALKELDDLLNNAEEDPVAYCSFDGRVNSIDIDRFCEWLNT